MMRCVLSHHFMALLVFCLVLSLPAEGQVASHKDATTNGSNAHQAGRSNKSANARAALLSNRILVALTEANGVPGMAAAVWRDDAIAWSGSSGYRDIEKHLRVDEKTIFRLASVSKLFAATAAAKLREEGALDVQAPVDSIVEYLPKQWPSITSAQLAAHISGIPHYQPVDEGRGKRRFATVREAVSLFDTRELLFAPSEQYSYSTWGYTLLSAVIEEASGRPYLDYLSEKIFPGLAIGPDATGSDNPNATTAYEFYEGAIRPVAAHDYSYSWGGAGMAATAPDLARFGGKLMAGEVVSASTLEWMLTPAQLRDGTAVMHADSTVGFGWRSGRDSDGDRTAHHAGVADGARSALVLYPDLRMGVSILSNASWVSGIEQTAIMLAAPFKPTASRASVSCPVHAVAYRGEYDSKPLSGTARVALEDGICTATVSVQNAFGEWLNGFVQKDADALTIIGLDQDGGLSRAALVTPIGAYDLRAQPKGDRHLASLGGKSTVWIEFITAAPLNPGEANR